MSKSSSVTRARSRVLALVSVVSVVAGSVGAVSTAEAAGDGSGLQRITPRALAFDPGRYVVILRDPPASRYAGGVAGLPATRVAPGQQLDARTAQARAYSNHLRVRQDRLAGLVGADVQRHFTLATNGFSAQLTGRQAMKLSSAPGVLLVQKDVRHHLDTWNTPDFLGLSGDGGAWQEQSGGRAHAGAGVVIGILDSGIWPESHSFDGSRLTASPKTKWDISRDGQDVRMEKVDGGVFLGRCQLTHQVGGVAVRAARWSSRDCTTKVIGARYYPDEFLAEVPPQHRSRAEAVSARDGNGHGTHTAGTAAGAPVADVEVEDVPFGEVSGMAPAARVAAYKVCFDDDDPDTGDCFTGATLAAIDDAVADGVDVINYSISGPTDTVLDATELAFEGAAEAGVFVATSGGNSGPGRSTVAHISPWLTTVAASTHHNFENSLVLGNGKRIRGASLSKDPVPAARLVSSRSVPAAGWSRGEAELCVPGSLDASRVEGKIVVCTRGIVDRVDKSRAVRRAGGVAMVLANVSPGSLDADFHSVPSVHIADTDSPTVFRYLFKHRGTATARIVLGDVTGKRPTPLPQVAGFSSRGPGLASGGDLLKPDVTAPGASVLAAVAPPSNEGRRFDLYSGTSMASPHVAGLAAFMLGVHPRWTPMMVKSAMMTSAGGLRTRSGRTERDPFAVGAGQVRPSRAFDPGLFVTSTPLDWRRYLQGQGLDWGEGYVPLAAKDLNLPSMAHGQVTSRTSFTREFVSTRKGTWKVSVHVPGFVAVARDKLVAKRRGDLERITVRLARTTAPLRRFTTGALVLDGPTQVRLPIAVRPVSVAAPAEVTGSGVQGSTTVPIRAGFTGDLSIAVTGLARARSTGATVPVGAFHEYCEQVSSGSQAARFDLDAGDDAADLDLYVVPANADCTEAVGPELSSATGSADERVTVLDPEATTYYVVVDGFGSAAGAPGIDYRLDVYDVDPAAQVGGLAAQPNPVPVVDSRPTSYDAAWSGLVPGSRYLGLFEYSGALSPTFLTVDTPASP